MCKRIGLIFCLSILFNACISTSKVQDGQTAFNLKRYNTAIKLFNDELNAAKSKEEKALKSFMLAQSLEKLNYCIQAIEYYTQSEKNGYGPEATLSKAFCMKKTMDYANAKSVFESLKSVSSLNQIASQQALLCGAFQLEKESYDKSFNIEPLLPDQENSSFGSIHYDQDYLVFTSDRNESNGKEKYEWTGRKYYDLFIMDKDNKTIKKFDSEVNSDFNDGMPAFKNNCTYMIFSRCYNEDENKNQYCQLMYSTRVNGLWTTAQKLPFVQDEVNYVHPTFFENDSVLIFAAKMKDEDNYNLYYTELDEGQWLDPEPLPQTINSKYNESFPTSDLDTLYFASDSPMGMGGYDIYKTFLKDGTWQKPQRLPFPINSGGDDFCLTYENYLPKSRNITRQGYLSSSRSNNGKDYLYRFYTIKQSEKEVPNVIVPNQKEFDVYLALKVYKSSEFGTNKSNAILSNAKVTVLSNNKVLFQGNTDRNGLLLAQLNKDVDYEIIASKDSFFNNKLYFNTRDIKSPDGNTVTINKELYLGKIERGKEILLENIYYDYDKWDIKPEAIPALEKLTELLNNNPQINIELGSHTDCRGNEEYNQKLSQRRAQSVIDFLIAKGVKKERLIATGYGESSPSIPCQCDKCTEEEHQKNRRTSFKIL